jgi:hypothetical protein
VYDGRTGHIWGDRYGSKIVEGPPKGAEKYVFAAVVRPENRRVRRAVKAGGGRGVPKSGGSAVDVEGRPHTGEMARNSVPPPGLSRQYASQSG